MGRPRRSDEPLVTISARVPAHTANRLAAEAKTQGVTISAIVAVALEHPATVSCNPRVLTASAEVPSDTITADLRLPDQEKCPHPKAAEIKLSWGVKCGTCSRRLR